MIKALLIVTALASGVPYTTEMSTMQACLDARVSIAKQDPTVKTLCVPKADETAKMKELFTIFMDILYWMKEQEEYSDAYQPFLDEKKNWPCSTCSK
jgi:hypothetical protein